MAKHYIAYSITEEEKKTLQKTKEIMDILSKNPLLDSHFRFSLVKELIELIECNADNKLFL